MMDSDPTSSTSHLESSKDTVDRAEAVVRPQEEINWKDRCSTLEQTLHKFKQQASNIRDLLAEKVACFYRNRSKYK